MFWKFVTGAKMLRSAPNFLWSSLIIFAIYLSNFKSEKSTHVARKNHETLKIQNFAKHFDFWVNLGHWKFAQILRKLFTHLLGCFIELLKKVQALWSNFRGATAHQKLLVQSSRYFWQLFGYFWHTKCFLICTKSKMVIFLT